MLSGLLLIDKPAGLSSFAVVRRVRRALRVRKVGHLGTLDPFATGLLPLCLGEATKLAPYLLAEAKDYRATLKLGEATDTQDLTGRVVSRVEILPSPAEVYAAAAQLVGEISQVPPMYSARHYQGERLYRLARQGKQVERPPRRVTIYRLEVEKVDLPLGEVTFTVRCSQGTYIRTLAADLGAALGCGAHLSALRRLQVGPFRLEEALTLEELEEAGAEAVLPRLIPLSQCLPGLRQVSVDLREAAKLRQGQAVRRPLADFRPQELVRVMAAGRLLALARIRPRDSGVVLAPVRVLAGSLGGAAPPGKKTKKQARQGADLAGPKPGAAGN